MSSTDWAWWAALLIQVLAIPGTLFPVLPGLVLLPVGALLWCWVVGFAVGWPTLALAAVLLLLGWGADLLGVLLGAARLQASRWAYVGAAAGLVLGLVGLLPALPVGGPCWGPWWGRCWEPPWGSCWRNLGCGAALVSSCYAAPLWWGWRW